MLAENLKRLRKDRKKTQIDIAKMLGIAKTTYAGYEQQRRTPDQGTLIKLADYYNVSTDELLGREPKKDFFHQADVLMFKDKDGWDKLSYEEQQRIMKELSDLADFYIAKENKGKE